MPIKLKSIAGVNPAIAQAFEGAYVFKLDAKDDLSKMNDQDLYFAHAMCHAFYLNMSRAVKIAGWTEDLLITHYKKIVTTMVSRKMQVVPTQDKLGESIVDIIPAIEKDLGVDDAGSILVQPKIQGAQKKKPSEVSDSDDLTKVMAEALTYFQKYDARSILAILQIAKEAEVLKEMEEAYNARTEEEASNALDSGRSKNW